MIGRDIFKKISYLLFVIFLLFFSLKLTYANEWAITFSERIFNYANSIQQTSDGGFIVAGWTSWDIWVLKLDENGNVQWQKTYGGGGLEKANSIQQTSDGGFIVAGYTDSFGAGDADIWVLKLDGNGNIQWQKTYGGSGWDSASSIQQTSDGGFIVAGYTNSFGAGYDDIWVLKLDESGNVQWQKTYGGSGWDSASSIQQTSDGGFIVAGWTNRDIWVLKLDGNGNIQWQKTYGGSYGDYANSIQQTSDGGFILAGYTYSFGAGGSDIWVLKLDESGNVQWQKTYGGSSDDRASSIQQTSDGGFILAGGTDSFGTGGSDIWVLKLDENGENACSSSNTNISPSETIATISNTSANISNTNASISNTAIMPIDTNATITYPCSSDLSITKTDSPDPVNAGETLTYTITVTNNGPNNADNVTVTDNLPSDVSYQSDTCGGSVSGQTWTWNVGSLNSGDSQTCQITVQVSSSASGVLNNMVNVSSSTPDPNSNNNQYIEVTAIKTKVLKVPTLNNIGLIILSLTLLVIQVIFQFKKRENY